MTNSQHQEFKDQVALLTRLTAAQIQVSVSEADKEVNQLTESFTDIVERDRGLRNLVDKLPDTEDMAQLKAAMSAQSSALGSNVQSAIIAFQFFDRMCQRLEHSISCLKQLSLLEQSDLSEQITTIATLRDSIYKSYTMEEERVLFDAVLNKQNFEQAIQEYITSREKDSADDDDDIEFF